MQRTARVNTLELVGFIPVDRYLRPFEPGSAASARSSEPLMIENSGELAHPPEEPAQLRHPRRGPARRNPKAPEGD